MSLLQVGPSQGSIFLWNQKSTSPDQFLGPWDPFWGILQPMEAEGQLNGDDDGNPINIRIFKVSDTEVDFSGYLRVVLIRSL